MNVRKAYSERTAGGGWEIQKQGVYDGLWFRHSQFSTEGVSRIEEAWNTNQTLELMRLENSQLTDNSVDGICRFISNNTTLKYILFTQSRFTDTGLRHVLNGLTKNCTLTTLRLDYSTITDAASANVEHFLLTNKSLQVLGLTFSTFTDEGMRLIMQGLTANQKLQELSLRFCHLSDASAGPIKDFATKNSTLRVLNLEDERLSDQEVEGILQGLSSNSSLKEFSKSHYDQVKRMEKEGRSLSTLVAELRDPSSNQDEDVPDELDMLDEEYVQAYREACAGGTETVNQCRVMMVGHEGVGKTNTLNTLVDRPFVPQHHPTNSMEINVSKTKDWLPVTDVNGHEEHIVNFMINAIKDKKTADRPEPEASARPAPQGNLDDSEMSRVFDMQGREEHGSTSTTAVQDSKDGPSHVHTIDTIPPAIAEILKHKIKSTKGDGRETFAVELFFWDSGGQALFYNTTKTFLSQRCIFIIAVDMTKSLDRPVPTFRKNRHGDDVCDWGCPQTAKEHLLYWLRCLHTFIPQTDQATPPSVIIVGTHKDGCTPEEEKTFRDSIRTCIEKEPYARYIHNIISLSNRHRDERDVCDLKESIIDLAKRQSYTLPLTWFALKEELLKYSSATVPRITLDEATEMGLKHGLKSPNEVLGALKFFHEIGDILFFHESKLRDFIITQPQWLINQFRKVLTVPMFRRGERSLLAHYTRLDEEGVLHDDVLQQVWPKQEKEQLIELMFKFSLLFPMPPGYVHAQSHEDDGRKQYLVPCLLPLSTQDDTQHMEDTSTSAPPLLLVPPKYFMPVGFTSRLFAGLVNEDDWKVAGFICGDVATFLPKGEESAIKINIQQTPGYLEVSGHELEGEDCGSDFSDSLSTILDRIDSIRLSHCPLQPFTVGMHCSRCKRRNEDSILQLGCKGKERKDFMFCSKHGNKIRTSEYSIWFSESHQQARCNTTKSRDLPLWDERHPDANTLVLYAPDLERKLTEATPRLKQLVRTENLWAYLQRYHVMSDSMVEQCQVGVRGQQVESLVKFLKQGEVWRTRGFFRSLAQIDQANLIDVVLGRGHKGTYTQNLLEK